MWEPLTWLSHMLDCQLYGLHPWGHHLTNILLARRHDDPALPGPPADDGRSLAQRLRGGPVRRPSAARRVGGLGGRTEGPLERTVLHADPGAYVGYVRRPFSLLRYLAVVVLFALGLMAKPMLVTLPFVLLLLDYWPLGRMAQPSGVAVALPPLGRQYNCHRNEAAFPWRLVVEKIPLLALTAASCVADAVCPG